MDDIVVAGHVLSVEGSRVLINGTPWDEVAAYDALTGQHDTNVAVTAAKAVHEQVLTLKAAARAAATYPQVLDENEYCTDVALVWFLIHHRPDPHEPPILVPSPESINRTVAVLLAQSPNPPERQVAARSRHTPPHALALLAVDEDVDVRAGVASNPRTAGCVLELLAQDQCVVVRAAAAGHAGLSTPTLTGLSKDPNRTVRAAAHAHTAG